MTAQPSIPVPATIARRRPQVVIIGGGFGGLTTIKFLAKSAADITLIDRHTYNTFQPLRTKSPPPALIQVMSPPSCVPPGCGRRTSASIRVG